MKRFKPDMPPVRPLSKYGLNTLATCVIAPNATFPEGIRPQGIMAYYEGIMVGFINLRSWIITWEKAGKSDVFRSIPQQNHYKRGPQADRYKSSYFTLKNCLIDGLPAVFTPISGVTPLKTDMAGRKISIFNRRYIFKWYKVI